jgi:hypothetical protein
MSHSPDDQKGTKSNPIDPKLGALNDNGGPTHTHALLNNSPAIDHGEDVTGETFFDCPQTDQRGYFRWVYKGPSWRSLQALGRRRLRRGCLRAWSPCLPVPAGAAHPVGSRDRICQSIHSFVGMDASTTHAKALERRRQPSADCSQESAMRPSLR